MKLTMLQQTVSVKSRKTAVFTAQMLAPRLMVNHF